MQTPFVWRINPDAAAGYPRQTKIGCRYTNLNGYNTPIWKSKRREASQGFDLPCLMMTG